MANKITTLGYFKKRMRDCGYIVDDVFRGYSKTDPRAWSIIIDPGGASVLCTCFMNANIDNIKESAIGEFYFELHDGGQYVPNQLTFKTSSIEVLMEWLVKFNINGKSTHYNKGSRPATTTQ